MLIVRPRSVLGGLPVAHWSSSPAAPNSSMFELRWSSGFSGFPRSCGGLDNAPSIVRSTQDLSRDHKTRRILVSNLPDAGDIVQATVQLEMIVVLWFLLTDPTVRVFQPRSHGLQMVFGVRRVCCQQLVDHGQAHTLIWWFLKHAGLFVYVHVHLDDPTAVTVFFREWISSSRRFWIANCSSADGHTFSELPPSLAKMVAAAGWIWGNQSLHSFKLS